MKSFVFCKTFLFFLCCFVLCSCGLETVVFVNPPDTAYHIPTVESLYDTAYFEFLTTENDDTSDFKFLGTAVYYKIYNNSSTLASQVSAIESLNSSTTASASANAMINTYKYQQLGCASGTRTPLIDAGGKNKVVYIRLTNYNEAKSEDLITYQYRAKIVVDPVGGHGSGGIPGSDSTEYYPMRAGNDNKLNFDFGRKYTLGTYDGQYVEPKNGDDDVAYGTATSEGKWYVAMFAVGVVRDLSFSSQYSNVLYLGAVTIDAETEDN